MIQMATVAINVVLRDSLIMAGNELYAKILLDTAEVTTFVNEFYADVEGIARTGWINIHTDKIFETGKVLSSSVTIQTAHIYTFLW